MRRRPYLPEAVLGSIQRHVSRAVRAIIEAHDSGQEDEDTLTGHVGFALRTRAPKRVVVQGDGRREIWTWNFGYHRLRGRGPRATERLTGADGVFQFSVNAVEQHFTKSALFQAKSGSSVEGLFAQSVMLSTWREAAFVMRYHHDGYTAFSLDEAMKQALRLPHAEELPLDVFIRDVFVACEVGDSELHYEPDERLLRWRDQNDQVVHASFGAKHLFDLQVNGPQGLSLYRGDRIEAAKIVEHRMKASDEEVLGLGPNASANEVRRAKRDRAKIYHTDRHHQLEEGVRHVLDLRMKEQNAAADRLLQRLKNQ